METQRWINNRQPQTLQIAVFLLYFGAGISLIFGDHRVWYELAAYALTDPTTGARNLSRVVWIGAVVAGVAGGFGIANERKWGYWLGLAAAIAPLAARLIVLLFEQISPFDSDPIGLMFAVALVALLVHPQSRDYQRIWFK